MVARLKGVSDGGCGTGRNARFSGSNGEQGLRRGVVNIGGGRMERGGFMSGTVC